MSVLFDPLTLGPVTLRNRVVMSPMSQNSSVDGAATPWHLVHYGSRAVGGCGLIIVEDTAVEEHGSVSSRALCLYDRRHTDALKPIVEFCRNAGATMAIQIAHAGRKAMRDRFGNGANAIAPSTEPFDSNWKAPRAASAQDLARVVEAFAAAAVLATDAGFEIIEIHAAHGYLLHEFLSPLTNTREDAYGGDCQGRCRLLVEVVNAVRRAAPTAGIMVRLPAADGTQGGLDIDDVVTIAASLRDIGVQGLDVGGSGLRPDLASLDRTTQVTSARRLREEIGLPVAAGGYGAPAHANDAVTSGACDLVALGRPILNDPYWTVHAATELEGPNLWPEQYPLRP